MEELRAKDCASDLQSAETLTHQLDIDVRGSGLESQDLLSEEAEFTPSALPLNVISSVNGETGLILQDQGDDPDSLHSCEGDHSTNEPASIQSQDPAPSGSSEQDEICHRENCAVPLAIPAAQPPKPRKRPYRLRTETQTYRTDPLDESDESDDSNDDDYVDRARHVEHRRPSTKRPKYQPIIGSDLMEPEAVAGFKLGDLSLPNLRTVQRGVLTCEFFPSQIMYSFSWAEERQGSDHLPTKDDLPSQGYNHHDVNSAQEWKPRASSKGETNEIPCSKQQGRQLSARIADPGKPLKRKEWTPEEDARLKQLREKDKLPWSQVKKHFPTQTAGAIQVRYSTALKDSTSMSRAPTRAHSDRSASFSPSNEPVLQDRTKDTLDTASDVTSRSRPVRARRAVERYSP